LALLLPHVSDIGFGMEIAAISALALGLIFVGSCNGEIASTILQTMMERESSQLKDPHARYMSLGLGLLFIGLFLHDT
jgi:26S proteasome regulatory subunit N1